jgi:hypothetical protein
MPAVPSLAATDRAKPCLTLPAVPCHTAPCLAASRSALPAVVDSIPIPARTFHGHAANIHGVLQANFSAYLARLTRIAIIASDEVSAPQRRLLLRPLLLVRLMQLVHLFIRH